MQTIVHADCQSYIKTVEPNSFDVVVTSPPYNLDIKYGEYEDNLPYDQYLNWLTDIFTNLKEKLKDDGSLFLNVGGSCKQPWIPFDMAQRLRDHYVLQNTFIWVKSISIGDQTFGQFKPINSDRYVNNNFEYIFHFTKSGTVKMSKKAVGVPYVFESNIKRFNHDEDRRCKGNCWHIPYETIQKKDQKGNHPAVFPVRLASDCIKIHGIKEGLVVYDPFMGTGSTLVAAKQLGVDAVGTEIDEDYISHAEERLTDLISVPMVINKGFRGVT